MTLRRFDVCVWLLAGSLLAAPLLAQSKKSTKTLTPEQQAAREKFDPKAQASPFGGSVVEDVVARVNDQIINTSDYDRAATQLEQEGRQQGWTDQDLESHKRDLLRDLIDQQLLLSKGKELGVTGETELVHRLDEIRKQNHLDSMEDLEKAATQQGVSYEDFKQNIRNGIVTQQVIRDQVGRHLQMTNAELQQFYKQHASEFTQPESVRLSEILVPVAATGDEAANLAAAKAKVDEVEAKVKAGDSFADLAKANSSGSTAAQGGDIGEWKRGSLAKQLEDATFALQSGQATAPIRTKQGYVILKVTEHTAGGTQDFASVRQQVEEAAFMTRMQPALRAYLAQLRQNAYVDVRPGYADSAAVPNSVKPLYSAYSVPAAKKKVHFKRTRYTGQHRGRHADATSTETANKTATPETSGATDTTAAGAATTAGGAATTATSGGTTTALAAQPSVAQTSTAKTEKPGKKEKIRYGQAPREALPPASQPTAVSNGSEQAAGADANAGNDAQVASNASSSTDVPEADAAPVEERKTRFSARARVAKAPKQKTADQIENERVEKISPEEQAAQQTQSAPLGLAGDTATKKKAPKVKGEKTRFSDEANKDKQAPAPAVPQSTTPSPLATPATVPAPTSSPDSAPANSAPAGQPTPAPATTPNPGTQPQP